MDLEIIIHKKMISGFGDVWIFGPGGTGCSGGLGKPVVQGVWGNRGTMAGGTGGGQGLDPALLTTGVRTLLSKLNQGMIPKTSSSTSKLPPKRSQNHPKSIQAPKGHPRDPQGTPKV